MRDRFNYRARTLTLTSGKTLTLAANGIELEGAIIQVDQGRVLLSSIDGAGEVDISQSSLFLVSMGKGNAGNLGVIAHRLQLSNAYMGF